VLAPTTLGLIAINLLVFVVGAIRDGGGLAGNRITATQADLGVSKAILQGRVLGLDGFPIPAHEWYRLATAGFVHFGIFHIAMNMLLLYQLGNLLERVIGSGRLLALYAAGLFAGSLGVLIADTIQGAQNSGITGGASGAVFGLMAAAAIGMHRRGINVFRTGIGTTLMLNLVLTFAITGVSVGGHLGGLAGGLLCGFVLFAPPWRPMPKWAGWLAPVAVIVVAIAGSVLITL
jgi:membrane associated rhomboid family serine protease